VNIIAIMGPHGVFYKDEPIRELDKALQARGYQLIWPQNSADLLKVIEHNPRICGVIFDWDEYDLELWPAAGRSQTAGALWCQCDWRRALAPFSPGDC
jgi:hypothetical protein